MGPSATVSSSKPLEVIQQFLSRLSPYIIYHSALYIISLGVVYSLYFLFVFTHPLLCYFSHSLVHIRGTYKEKVFEERDVAFDYGEGQ